MSAPGAKHRSVARALTSGATASGENGALYLGNHSIVVYNVTRLSVDLTRVLRSAATTQEQVNNDEHVSEDRHRPGCRHGSCRMQWQPPPPAYARGYGKLFLDHVLQAHRGCDFDFLLPEA